MIERRHQTKSPGKTYITMIFFWDLSEWIGRSHGKILLKRSWWKSEGEEWKKSGVKKRCETDMKYAVKIKFWFSMMKNWFTISWLIFSQTKETSPPTSHTSNHPATWGQVGFTAYFLVLSRVISPQQGRWFLPLMEDSPLLQPNGAITGARRRGINGDPLNGKGKGKAKANLSDDLFENVRGFFTFFSQ